MSTSLFPKVSPRIVAILGCIVSIVGILAPWTISTDHIFSLPVTTVPFSISIILLYIFITNTNKHLTKKLAIISLGFAVFAILVNAGPIIILIFRDIRFAFFLLYPLHYEGFIYLLIGQLVMYSAVIKGHLYSYDSSEVLVKKNKLFYLVSFMSLLPLAWFIVSILLYFLPVFSLLGQSHAEKSATCAWLHAVPSDWECKDTWQGKDRRLRASNPKHPEQFLEWQISNLSPYCINILPVGFIGNASFVGITAPFICVNSQGFAFQSDWNQDGYAFRLIGKNVSRKLYIASLYSSWGNQNEKPDALFTYNNTYKITPTNIRLTNPSSSISPKNMMIEHAEKSNTIQFALVHTHLCTKNVKGKVGLREQITVRFGKNQIPGTVSIKSGNECILMVTVPDTSLELGKNNVTTEVNLLRQNLRDQIDVTLQ